MKKVALQTKGQRFGRPCLNSEIARNKRVVTFVTNSELAKLKHIAEQERISISAVVHQILSESIKTNPKEGHSS